MLRLVDTLEKGGAEKGERGKPAADGASAAATEAGNYDAFASVYGEALAPSSFPHFTVSPRAVAKFLAAIMVALIAVYAASQAVRFLTPYNSVFGLIQLFNMYEESNLPMWFESVLFLAAAALLGTIAWVARLAGDALGKYWWGLAGVFLFLSVDEAAMLHERIGAIFKAAIGAEGMRSAWMYPFAAMLGILGVVYARFLLALPAYFRTMFVVSGLIFVGGAIGIEFIEAKYTVVTRTDDLIFALLVGVEETMEMGGIIMFIYVLLRYLQTKTDGLTIAMRR